MSAGNFVRAVYEADYGAGDQTHPIRVQPETLLLATIGGTAAVNVNPGGTPTNPISAICSNGRQELGLTPRKVTIRVNGTPPDGYSANSTVALPCLTKDFSTGLVPGVEVSYLGADWVVIGFSPERVK